MKFETSIVGAEQAVIGRAEALRLGMSHYFTGKPCKRGHMAVRHIAGDCMECNRIKQAIRLATDPSYRALHNRLTLKSRTKALADPTRREKIRDQEQIASQKPERVARKAEADALRNQRQCVKLSTRERAVRRYYRLKETNPVEFSRMQDARKLALRIATPLWVKLIFAAEIAAFYLQAQRLTRQTGIKHHVDRIVPLQHPLVCGLHVPANLRVVPAIENARKHNKFHPELASLPC